MIISVPKMAEDCIIKEDHETSEIQQNDKENISLNGNNLMEIQVYFYIIVKKNYAISF